MSAQIIINKINKLTELMKYYPHAIGGITSCIDGWNRVESEHLFEQILMPITLAQKQILHEKIGTHIHNTVDAISEWIEKPLFLKSWSKLDSGEQQRILIFSIPTYILIRDVVPLEEVKFNLSHLFNNYSNTTKDDCIAKITKQILGVDIKKPGSQLEAEQLKALLLGAIKNKTPPFVFKNDLLSQDWSGDVLRLCIMEKFLLTQTNQKRKQFMQDYTVAVDTAARAYEYFKENAPETLSPMCFAAINFFSHSERELEKARQGSEFSSNQRTSVKFGA